MNKAFDHSKYANWIDPNAVIPYSKNAKRHAAKQVANIAESIKKYGWQQDTVITSDNVLVIGHGRRLAALRLGCQMPYHMIDKAADELTEDDIKELRIIDNKVAESEWNFSLLAEEIAEIDLSSFDVDFKLPEVDVAPDGDKEDSNEPKDTRSASVRHNVFENQERMQFPILNYYGIPVLAPTQTTGRKFCRFMDYQEIDNPSEYICHFYYDDFKFISAWREPDKYVERLKKFKAVICPDFSSYTDFPIALQILGAYRRNWCGAFWQTLGMDVIPDVQWGNNEETYKWCFEGIPANATVAISSLGAVGKDEWERDGVDLFKQGFDEMITRLHPTTILWYGNYVNGCEGNIIRIPSYYEQKRDVLNKQNEVLTRGKSNI